MTRFDGRGYHPTVRPFIPHRKKESNKSKVMRIVSPKAWQLAMMRLKMCFVADRDEIITLDKLFDAGLLDSSETMLMEPICAGEVSCGTVGDYSMVHTDPSRPPPKNTWIHKAIQYIVVLLLAALMAMATACHKDPTPEPNPTHPTDTITPNDTIPPIIPTREIVIPWCWGSGDGLAPCEDTIKYYSQQLDVKQVIIYMVPGAESTWEPRFYNIACDSLEKCFNIDTTKITGGGKVKVGRDGAHIHPDTLTKKYGMWFPDSIRFTKHNIKVERFNTNSK